MLNVRTPDVTGRRPVILWIHGGKCYLRAADTLRDVSAAIRTVIILRKTFYFVIHYAGGLVAGNGEEAGYHQDADYTEALDVVSVNINYRYSQHQLQVVVHFSASSS